MDTSNAINVHVILSWFRHSSLGNKKKDLSDLRMGDVGV